MSTVLFAYAHPDDESFGIAGTAMKLKADGHLTALLTLTRGDAGLWAGDDLLARLEGPEGPEALG